MKVARGIFEENISIDWVYNFLCFGENWPLIVSEIFFNFCYFTFCSFMLVFCIIL